MTNEDLRFLDVKFESIGDQIKNLKDDINKLSQSLITYQEFQRDTQKDIYNKLNKVIIDTEATNKVTEATNKIVENIKKDLDQHEEIINKIPGLEIKIETLEEKNQKSIDKKYIIIGFAITIIIAISGWIFSKL